MPPSAVGRLIGGTDTRVWRLLRHRVGEARQAADYFGVRCVGMDETACRRGHDYITLFADLQRSRLSYATEGRGPDVVEPFCENLPDHGGEAQRVEELCMDMLTAYLKGACEQPPDAAITFDFDRFLVPRFLYEAIEEVRRAEQKDRRALKQDQYLLLRHPTRLTVQQRASIDEQLALPRVGLKTARPYWIKLAFQEFWSLPRALAEASLTRWCSCVYAPPAASRHQGGPDDQTALDRHHPRVPGTHQQRHARGHELIRPGGKGYEFEATGSDYPQ